MSTEPARPVEIRVHGIGDKDALASLGSPTVLDTVDGRAEVVIPPALPHHRVLLVNWARWNRSGSALGWLASWPFSLLNAAGEMRPPARAGVRHTLLIHVLSLTATVVAFAWLAASFEALARSAPTPAAWDTWTGVAAVTLAAAVLLAVVAYRAASSESPPRIVTAAHTVVLLAAAGILILVRPSQRTVEVDWDLLRGFAVDSYTTSDFDRIDTVYRSDLDVDPVLTTQYADPLAWVGYLSLATAGLLLLLGVLAHRTPSTQCALLVGAIAVTLLNLYGAVLLALTQSVLSTLSGVGAIQRVMSSEPRLDDAILIGRTGQGLSSRMIPLVALLALVAMLLLAALVSARPPLKALVVGDRRTRLNRWAHAGLPTLGARLTDTLWLASVAVLLLVQLLGLGVGVFADRWGDYETVNHVQSFKTGPLVRSMVWLSGGVLTAALFALRNASLRARLAQVLAVVGDIIGFWPISSHPLAARSYRPAALEAIRRAVPDPLSETAVLVGHSQGSILAAWHVAHTTGFHHGLITCGSPLVSLYSQFFPAHFNEVFFAAVDDNTHTWTNVWRDTDPIATSVPQANHNIQSPDPAADGVLHGHSNYWTDPLQTAAVLDVLDDASAEPTRSAPPGDR